MVATYLNWETQNNFDDEQGGYEHRLLNYIFQQWSLTGYLTKGDTMQDEGTDEDPIYIIFKPGYPSGNRPFQITAVRTTIEPQETYSTGHAWQDGARVRINIRCRRQDRPNSEDDDEGNDGTMPAEFHLMESEVERIARQMQANGITGFMRLVFLGNARVENQTNFASSLWESNTLIGMEYVKQNHA